jgi:hypothetical protein
MTKPFQSIRQLFGRVLGGRSADQGQSQHEGSTLGLGQASESSLAVAANHDSPHTNVKVFIEAPLADDLNSSNLEEASCHADIDTQTADTMKLPPVDAQALVDMDSNFVADERINAELMTNTAETGRSSADAERTIAFESLSGEIHKVERVDSSTEFSDALLDLGEARGSSPAAMAEDFVLDLGDEMAPHAKEDLFVGAIPEAPAAEDTTSFTNPFSEDLSEAAAPVPVFEERKDWSIAAESVAVEVAQTESEAGESIPASGASPANGPGLSPEAIDAIAESVVAQLSDKVVREIAWEVVPELAELLIKEKLEEK